MPFGWLFPSWRRDQNNSRSRLPDLRFVAGSAARFFAAGSAAFFAGAVFAAAGFVAPAFFPAAFFTAGFWR